MSTLNAEAPDIVAAALAHAVAGDFDTGAELLVPLIADSARSAYALAGMLAETASHIARREQRPGTWFGIQVEHTITGEPDSLDGMPPEVMFAARFTTAWANRDQDTTAALFAALAEQTEASGSGLVEGLLTLFEMAVITATTVSEEERAKRHNNPTQKEN